MGVLAAAAGIGGCCLGWRRRRDVRDWRSAAVVPETLDAGNAIGSHQHHLALTPNTQGVEQSFDGATNPQESLQDDPKALAFSE